MHGRGEPDCVCLHLNCQRDGSNGDDRFSALERTAWLTSLEFLLWRMMGSEGRAEARLWLCGAIASFPVQSRLQASPFLNLIRLQKELQEHDDGDVMILRQILRLACEKQPRMVMHLFDKDSRLIRSFFSGNPKRILQWFEKFSTTSKADYELGAQALAQYAFVHRNNCWKELEWKGTHGQAPATVASKPYYFLDLDVLRTVENFLNNVPLFWSSDELWNSLKEGTILSFDVEFFIDRLLRRILDESSSVWKMIKEFLTNEKFSELCTRILPFFSDKKLLTFVNELSLILDPSKYVNDVSKSSTGEDIRYAWLKEVAHFGEECPSLDCVIISNACISHARQLHHMLMNKEDGHECSDLNRIVLELKGNKEVNDKKHWALLKDALRSSNWEGVKWLALEVWSIYVLITNYYSSESSLKTLLLANSVEFHHSFEGHRKSKKIRKKKRTRKKRKRRKDYNDSDSLSCDHDNEDDHGCIVASEAAWYLSLDGFSKGIEKAELPEHISYHAFRVWWKCLFEQLQRRAIASEE